MKMNKKQNGVTLLEMILSLGLFGIIMLILITYMQHKTEELKIQATARQMEQIMENITHAAKRDFNILQNIPVGDGLIRVSNNGVSILDDTDIIKYTPLDTNNFTAFLRRPNSSLDTPLEEQSIQLIMYAKLGEMSHLSAIKLAKSIKNSQGGLVYFNSSPSSPCVNAESFCIANPYGVWQIKSPAEGDGYSQLADTETILKLEAFIDNNSIAPAIVLVNNLTADEVGNDYISRIYYDQFTGENHTMHTDLNISNNSSIFFNGDINDGDFEGTSLAFSDEKMTCPDTDGDGVYFNAQGDCIDPLIVLKQASFSIDSNRDRGDGINENPMFISKGGIKTNLQVPEGDICDMSIHKNVIGVDETTGEPLRCYAKDIGETTSGFLGEWRNIAWNESIIFLNKAISIVTDNGVKTGVTSGRTLEEMLGNEAEKTNFLLLSIDFSKQGRIRVSIDGETFVLFENASNNSFSNNNTKQVIVPAPLDKNASDWMSVTTQGGPAGVFDWAVSIVGYIK